MVCVVLRKDTLPPFLFEFQIIRDREKPLGIVRHEAPSLAKWSHTIGCWVVIPPSEMRPLYVALNDLKQLRGLDSGSSPRSGIQDPWIIMKNSFSLPQLADLGAGEGTGRLFQEFKENTHLPLPAYRNQARLEMRSLTMAWHSS